jgi:hypothetical protein
MMKNTGMTFTRKGLYDMLSQTTIRQVATDWHLDLRSLVDAIKANDIPCGSEASWIATVRGKQVPRRFLDGDPDATVYIPYSMDVYPQEQTLAVIFGVEDKLDQFEHNGIMGMGLNKRSVRCLEDAGIETVSELLNHTIAELFQVKNVGMTSVENIVVTCEAYCRHHR